ncbi:MAG: hypothetical protein KAI73_04540, partial [Rhodospirillaceae bacterium]|nr:hypothetical protein [Rhodospirillaceae bacterium]
MADMPETHAVIMDNWFPGTDKVNVRRGNSAWASGMSGNVETLVEYTPLTGTGEMFAANAGDIYDVSGSGAVGAAVVSGQTNDRWQQSQLGTAAGQFVRIVNGDDTPWVYNGSTWANTPAITGVTEADLIWINNHQRRLWVGTKDSLDAYYLAVNSIGGAATKFSLAGIAKLGGFIMAMGTWTRDAGDGMDDVAVFITSEGEAIVYSGIDPSAASTWALIGVFRIGKPIGRRCMVKAGSDLILVTQDGFVPLSAILTMDRSQSRLATLSDQIASEVNKHVRDDSGLFGWQPILYPKGTMLVFNIPKSSTTFHQYVFNTITGAPCKFDYNASVPGALCFALLNDSLYWGGTDGTVNKFDDGNSDLGTNIDADCLQAFSYFKSPMSNKIFKQAEPIFESDGDPNAAIDMNVDFQIKAPI